MESTFVYLMAIIGVCALLPTLATAQSCTIDEFECANGRCIPGRYVCDGKDDCRDGGSDEKQENMDKCPSCREGQFQCAYGGCIRNGWACDGAFDCRDGSDEPSNRDLCPACDENQFRCHVSQRCISQTWICDGKNDCIDGSDERQDCPACTGGRFQCAIGGCIPKTYVCDNWNDCLDWSDESEQTCPCADNEVRCAEDHPGDGPPGTCIPSSWWCDAEGIWDCANGSDELNCTIDDSSKSNGL